MQLGSTFKEGSLSSSSCVACSSLCWSSAIKWSSSEACRAGNAQLSSAYIHVNAQFKPHVCHRINKSDHQWKGLTAADGGKLVMRITNLFPWLFLRIDVLWGLGPKGLLVRVCATSIATKAPMRHGQSVTPFINASRHAFHTEPSIRSVWLQRDSVKAGDPVYLICLQIQKVVEIRSSQSSGLLNMNT